MYDYKSDQLISIWHEYKTRFDIFYLRDKNKTRFIIHYVFETNTLTRFDIFCLRDKYKKFCLWHEQVKKKFDLIYCLYNWSFLILWIYSVTMNNQSIDDVRYKNFRLSMHHSHTPAQTQTIVTLPRRHLMLLPWSFRQRQPRETRDSSVSSLS